MSNAQIIDLAKLFEKTFQNTPYFINKNGALPQNPIEAYQLTAKNQVEDVEISSRYSSTLKENYRGTTIVLPVKFFDIDMS